MLGNPVVVVVGIISAASLSAAGLPRTDHCGRLLNVTSLKETCLKFQFNYQRFYDRARPAPGADEYTGQLSDCWSGLQIQSSNRSRSRRALFISPSSRVRRRPGIVLDHGSPLIARQSRKLSTRRGQATAAPRYPRRV
jgi:hypothetical protein